MDKSINTKNRKANDYIRSLIGRSYTRFRKFDEYKKVEGDFERITIRSDCADVFVKAWNTNEIEASFYGEAFTDEMPTFIIEKKYREVVIILNDASIISNLVLVVCIPARMFKAIKVTNTSDVTLNYGVQAKKIRISTANGNLRSESEFEELSLTTQNGDIKVFANARNDVEIQATTQSGNVSVKLLNIAMINLWAYANKGKKTNRFCSYRDGFNACVRAISRNGDVTIE